MSVKHIQTCYGRRCVKLEGGQFWWFEQRVDGVYVRRKYGRKWQRVGFDLIRDYAIGQFTLSFKN